MAATIAAVAGILFGFDTGVISGAILYIKPEFHLTDGMNELVVSSVLIGALVGSFISGSFADRYGRKKLLIITSLIFMVGTLGCAYTPNIPMLIVSRFVIGFAIGIASFAAPLYISEISPREYRGALVSLNQLAITIGILVAYLVDTVFAHSADNWRWMFGFGMIPAAVLFVGMLALPRSPRWLVSVGRVAKAKETLQRIRGFFYEEEELEGIKNSVSKGSDWTMLFQRWLAPAVVIGLGLGLLQQFTGINTIIYYAPTIFKMTGVSSNAGAIYATISVGVVNVLFTIIALPLIDRWGRRPLLLTGMSLMLVSLVLMTLSFNFAAHAAYLKWCALGSMLVFIAGFAISLGPIMWLIIAEIFPLEIRGFATSVMVSASWLFNFIVAQTFLTLIHHLGQSGTFMIYAVICFLGIIFVQRKIPETKGVTLEEIENTLRENAVEGKRLTSFNRPLQS
jgi:SP family galactose:H+ symporter-like MFS transporter